MIRLGRWIFLTSLILLVLSVAPIILYSEFGPERGNPVGLGLLMVFGSYVFSATGFLGLLLWVIGKFKKPHD